MPPIPNEDDENAASAPMTGEAVDDASTATTTTRHAHKMAARKAARDKIMAGKTGEKGLVIVHTGPGKGKSTAAFGMVLRAVGHGLRVVVVQFVKGGWSSGERAVLERFAEQVTLHVEGEGFTWETQNRTRDIAAAKAGWARARAALCDPEIALVVLDELNIVLRYDTLALEPVLAALAARPPGQHVVITGRNAPAALLEAADLVTEMVAVKHPFRNGIKAQAGIEF